MGFFRGYSQVIRMAGGPARYFMLSTIVYGLGMTLMQLYLNFFLQALGLDQGWIGLINAAPQLTVVATTFVIGGISARIGPWRGLVMGTAIAGAALVATALASDAWVILGATIVAGFGGGFVWSNTSPFLMAHSEERSRSAIFSLQAALGTLTGFVAYLGGGMLPSLFGSALHTADSSAPVMRGTLLLASLFYGLALIPAYLAGKAKGGPVEAPAESDEAALHPARKRGLPVSNLALVTRLLLPGLVVSLGAGMTMPFMNIYVEQKFNVSFEGLGQIFAWSAVATAAALLVQPLLADRYGRVKSVVIVQGASLPFLLVLGYAQFFPLVVLALFVRAALMNMGNPVFSAYCMERVPSNERATFSSLSSSSWSLGWAAGSWLSGALRDLIGFTAGFNLLFGMMAVLYASSMVLTWVWFVPDETRRMRQREAMKDIASHAAA